MRAVRAMNEERFDLVLTDIHMPGMDGIEATKAIRADEITYGRARTPIIALTADAMETGKRACKDAGMDGFLTKPVDPALLDQMFETFFPAGAQQRRRMSDASGAKRHPLQAYLRPRTLMMLALGFSSGLPFLLVGNTFGYWLRDEGTTLTAIGVISWVGIAYSLQFLWAPILDRVPSLKFLGQRRGWMVLSQIFVAAGLFAMAIVGTRYGLGVLAAFALSVAFSSATQDIVIAAWRIEIAARRR